MILVFDVGGTMTKYGVYTTEDNQPVCAEQGEFPSLAIQSGEVMLNRLTLEIDRLSARYTIDGIAISSAGQIDPFSGEVVFATDNIPGYTGMNLIKRLNERYNIPVSIENDVNCFLIGECQLRGLRGNVLALTLGTGIGGAILSDGVIMRGASFSAGEIGHIQLVKNGLSCTCGFQGCYEQYASTNALKLRVQASLNIDDLKLFFEKCKSQEKEALSIFETWIEDVTDGLKTVTHILNPNTIVIGGAIAAQGRYLETYIEKSLKRKVMPSYAAHLNVVVSDHGNTSNLLGALEHFYIQNPRFLKEE